MVDGLADEFLDGCDGGLRSPMAFLFRMKPLLHIRPTSTSGQYVEIHALFRWLQISFHQSGFVVQIAHATIHASSVANWCSSKTWGADGSAGSAEILVEDHQV